MNPQTNVGCRTPPRHSGPVVPSPQIRLVVKGHGVPQCGGLPARGRRRRRGLAAHARGMASSARTTANAGAASVVTIPHPPPQDPKTALRTGHLPLRSQRSWNRFWAQKNAHMLSGDGTNPSVAAVAPSVACSTHLPLEVASPGFSVFLLCDGTVSSVCSVTALSILPHEVWRCVSSVAPVRA